MGYLIASILIAFGLYGLSSDINSFQGWLFLLVGYCIFRYYHLGAK